MKVGLNFILSITVMLSISSCNDSPESIEDNSYVTILPNTSWICYFGGSKLADSNGEVLSCFFYDEKRMTMVYYNWNGANSNQYKDVHYIVSGTYSINGNTISVDYSDVEVKQHFLSLDEEIPTSFKGFTDGEPRNMKITIISCNQESLILKDDDWNSIEFERQ